MHRGTQRPAPRPPALTRSVDSPSASLAMRSTTQGVSSVLDAASTNIDAPPRQRRQQAGSPRGRGSISAVDRQGRPRGEDTGAADEEPATSSASASERPEKPGRVKGDRASFPNPLERVEVIGRSSAAGSLRLVSAAVRGVGEALFQAGNIAEGLAGGTGQVAGKS